MNENVQIAIHYSDYNFSQKLTAKEDVSTKETENNMNCLEQYDPPAKRIKREEMGRAHDINVLTCKNVLETSGADKAGTSDGYTELELLVSIEDEIEEEYKQEKGKFSDIRIKEIKVQASEFPRYEFALSNMLDVVMRYKVVLQSNCIGQDGRYILFYVCTTPENDKMIDDFLQEIFKKGTIRDGGSLEQFVQSIDQSAVSCFIIPVNYQHILTAIRHRTTMTFILGNTDLDEKSIQRCQNTYAIQKNIAWKQIDSVLEEWLFQSLKPVCGALGGDIERNRFDKNATNRDEYEEKPITDDEQTNETNVIIFLKKDMLSTLKTETKDCLFEEIIGLFNMSDVSIDDIPNIPKYRSDLDLKEICRHLSSTFKGICGVGCRMQKLQIVVKDVQTFTREEKQNRLRQVLLDFKIYEYELVPMSIKKYLTPGDSIAVGYVNNGSFGCFAKETKTQNEEIVMYGLFSKHLVPASNQINRLHVMEGGEPKSVGEVIDSTVECGKLDIAAAALSIRKDECDTRFKTVSGKQISGDKRIIESENLVGRKVHIWGAKSKPGKGIITVPEYRSTEEMDFSLILVEDIADGEGIVGERFSQPGDSGAIACTDVPGQECVIPISMIMGVMNYTEVDEDDKQNIKRKKGRYATVPLQSGLRQISERIGKQVELC
ncbi:uncharacterized protein LOC132723041 [Ruditapes philippinarum]|uniref:uncharacterized protein LOC132723041 n=1 Tax=Ruditapes philippinarum TaxID=129788 RepID=UPI00295B9D0D|nr:uncharacterized protein LOC132723041 [Ruditapes philippinarum]